MREHTDPASRPRLQRRRRRAALCAAVLGLMSGPAALAATPAGAYTPPPVKHVFVIVLENENASTTFAANSPAPYLANTLRSQGAYVPKYYGTGHESLDNYISMISGQAPNSQTQGDCLTFSDFQPGTMGADGQAIGQGCVYPKTVPTIASQLQGAGLTWRSYAESMGSDPTREASTCGHPGVGSVDNTQSATAKDQYATRHNPFVYFHAIIDDTALCDSRVVNLNALPRDLASAATTPNYTFIVPDLCSDGHDATCADASRPGGFKGIDAFLAHWVPLITSSPAYLEDGLLLIFFDEASSSDASACCGEIAGPNSPAPGIQGPGGGDTGAVALSPFIAPGTVSEVSYNHYTLLRSIEDLFGLAHIGYAGLKGETSFGADIFTRPGGPPPGSAPPVPVAPPCTVRRLPAHAHGHLPAGALLQGIHLFHTTSRRTGIRLRTVHPALLTIRVRPRGHHAQRTILRRRVQACQDYSVLLPRGHGVARIRAAIRRGAQVTARRY